MEDAPPSGRPESVASPDPAPRPETDRAGSPAPFALADWSVLLLLAALAFGFHGRYLLTGRVRMGEDLTHVRDPLRTAYVEALREGRLALWEPRINLGTPLFAESQLGQLHPFNLAVFSLLPAHVGGIVWNTVLCFAGGAFMFLFAREIGVGPAGRMLAAVMFMFSGFYLSHVNHLYAFLLQGAHVPLVLLFAERIARGRAPWSVWGASVVFGLAVLAGHFQLTFQGLLLYLFYGGWRAAQGVPSFRRWLEHAMWLLVPLAAAAALSAVQWMPTLELSGLFGAGQEPVERSMCPVHPWQLIGFVNPHLFRVAAHLPGEGFWALANTNYWESLAYIGVLPLALAAVGWGSRRTRRPAQPLMVAAVGFVLLALGGLLPTHWLLARLPGFGFFRAPGRYLFGMTVCAAALAGIGLDAAWRVGRARAGRWFRRFALFLGAAAVAALVVGGAERSYVIASSPGEYAETFDGILVGVMGRWALGVPCMVVSLAALWWVAGGRPFGRVAAVAVVTIDLLAVGLACETIRTHTVSRDALGKPGAVLKHLPPPHRAGPVLCDRYTCPAGSGHQFLYIVTPNLPEHQRFVSRLLDRPYWRTGPALAAYGVRYLVKSKAVKHPGLRLLYEGPDAQIARLYGRRAPEKVFVYECRDAMPRAYLVPREEWHYSRRNVALTVLHPQFRYRDRVILLGPAPTLSPPADAPDTPGTCRILAARPERLDVDVEARYRAWLVVNDTQYPGWSATIDGRPQPQRMWRANVFVRALPVPAGKHTVTFTYRCRPFERGGRVSGVAAGAVLLWAAGLVVLRLRRRRRAP